MNFLVKLLQKSNKSLISNTQMLKIKDKSTNFALNNNINNENNLFDYSANSIKYIEELIYNSKNEKNILSNEEIFQAGLYFGETLKQIIGGEWIISTQHNLPKNMNFVVKLKNGNIANPIGRILKYNTYGEQYSLDLYAKFYIEKLL